MNQEFRTYVRTYLHTYLPTQPPCVPSLLSLANYLIFCDQIKWQGGLYDSKLDFLTRGPKFTDSHGEDGRHHFHCNP
jgi:hypothetical protein